MWLFYIAASLFCINAVTTQNTPRIPPNPCPKVFMYYYDADNSIFGEILVPNDGSKIFRMEVNTSYVGLFNEQSRPLLKLDLTTPKDYLLKSKQLTYRLKFSRQDILPRITQVRFNGRIYCNGPSETLTSAGVSELWVFKETRLQTFSYPVDSTVPFYPTTTRPPTTMSPSRPDNLAEEYPGFSSSAGENGAASLIDNSQTNQQCGMSDRTMNLIVDGTSTIKNEYPWLAALYIWKGLDYQFRCTASLVDTSHVVTAAHCLRFYNSFLDNKEDILLVFGQSRLSHWAENSDTILRSVRRIDVHPDYQQYSGHGDIVVLTLNEPVKYSKKIKPICIWNTNDDIRNEIGQFGLVSGWGKDEHQQEFSVDAKKFEMPIVSHDTCIASHRNFQQLLSENTFCAGQRNGRGPCSSDSGSPFMMQKNGRWILRGIVSQAIIDKSSSLCDLRQFVVFADAAKYASWIRSKLY